VGDFSINTNIGGEKMSARKSLSLIVKTVLLVIVFLVIYIGAAMIFLPEL
jgi:hypothetical protein